MTTNGGVVLVGGRSDRMGASKATLAWHGSTLVRRVAGIVARSVDGPVVVVRSPGQSLPILPAEFDVLDDLEVGRGPLAGLLVGLKALAGRSEAAYVSSTDTPFLHPAFVHRVLEALDADTDACVPNVRGFRQPLAAAYRVNLASLVAELVEADQLRVSRLLEACRAKILDEDTLLSDPVLDRADPFLESVTNLNDQVEYEAACLRPQPRVHIEWLEGDPARTEPSGPQEATVRAASLGGALKAIGPMLDSWQFAGLNGKDLSPDLEEPLVQGDVVSLRRVSIRS